MQNAINVALLLCAIATCLAVGVGMAYLLCNALFTFMRPKQELVPAPAPAKVKAAA